MKAITIGLLIALSLAIAKAAPSTNKVLILGTTVTPLPDVDPALDGKSFEERAVMALGLVPDKKTDAQWALLTSSDFASYRAIVLGDDSCSGLSDYQFAVNNRAVWSPQITGNIRIDGTDPVFHTRFSRSDIVAVINSGIAFAVADPTKVGGYISLGCSYSGVAANTVIELLSFFGTFTASGVSCAANSHIVASHPSLAGLTDVLLSNWGCSVHNIFPSFPPTFIVLAIATDPSLTGPGVQTFADGSQGMPYILARGAVPVLCGDGVVQSTESCDNGALNGVLGNACSSTCKLHWCGDSVVDPAEGCDLGPLNGVPASPCGSDCTVLALPPVVRCKDVFATTDAACLAAADVNDASFDPNGGLLNCVQSPESPYSIGTQTITLTCTNAASLTGSCSSSVTVIDNLRPTITCPGDQRTQCTSYLGTPITSPSATATDNCGGKIVLTCVSRPWDPKCTKEGFSAPGTPFTPGTLLSLGKHEITCTATDASANSANCSYVVRVVDTAPPKLTCPTPSPVECENKRGVVKFSPVATDACSPPGTIDVRCTPGSGSSFRLGTTKVKCVAKDAAGNCGSCSFPVIIQDTLPPVLVPMKMARRYEKCDKRRERIRAKECSGSIRDKCFGVLDSSDCETVSFSGATCNEKDSVTSGAGLGVSTGDVRFVIPKGKKGAGELSFCIDRDPKGSGRKCTFDLTATDPVGNSATFPAACSAVVTDKKSDPFPPDGSPKLCRKCVGGKVSDCSRP